MPRSEGSIDQAVPDEEDLSGEDQGLDELAAPAPDENPADQGVYRHSDLEDEGRPESSRDKRDADRKRRGSCFRRSLTQLYIYSYLVFFSILGVLARLGLQALTLYPGAPVPTTDLWANFAGCLVIGFLREDRMLFHSHWRKSQPQNGVSKKTQAQASQEAESASSEEKGEDADPEAIRKAYEASRAAVPGYIGVTVGFCGSLTTFASVARDAFLAISNNLKTDPTATHFVTARARSRSAGYSVMALLAVWLLEVSLSLIALKSGAHLAIVTAALLENKTPKANYEKFMNLIIIPLSCAAWIGSIIFAIFTPHSAWRGQVLFALVFAPLGCILRFQLSVSLNRRISSFPLGTFFANILGSLTLGMCYDLQRSSAAQSVIGCQVLQGIEEGFSGALTTFSTWALELDTLKIKHAYFYGACTVCVAVAGITIIMGSLRWTTGFMEPACAT
ncbi:hypothetical protein KC343_g608 [Hortaea werneckii]|uniref:Uncharacterized protein n=1 Tax=Hortaea werneckii TaxID=91943 RepID=A0A3M7GDS0_HORWE|nr:hypothetical protein KC352_g4186 [Hortaea werneckii]KAI7572537.1 hypothetical protein KC317_g674 [Hortaea werneckii]KAI7627610.1 hypothetical protein KC346_g660 [Hortaea werneckii]KAI7637616.1 hypothetical protein KC343_g608 [Hortaea werneckii]KAI7683285.1 hypothetical protein KC319_g543 [Hortaea werneckii]